MHNVVGSLRRLAKEAALKIGALVSRDDGPKVVFYHDIGRRYTPMGTDETVFWKHLQCLRAGDVVCFDDGFRGIWDARETWRSNGALARVRAGHIRVIVFIAVDLVGRAGYLTWGEIRILQDEYGFEFQSHTWSHQTLAGPWNEEVATPDEGRTDEWYSHELNDSRAELERRLGRHVTSLCLPVGYFSEDVIRRCRDAGYRKVYVCYPGGVTDGYLQPRCLVQDLSVPAFRAVLNGGMAMLSRRYIKLHRQNS